MATAPAEGRVKRRRSRSGAADCAARRAWSAEEDEALRAAVLAGGARRWGDIAGSGVLANRSGKSCRLRWANHLHPRVCKEPFTVQEDRHVVLSYAAHGPKWALMARGLPGRTDSAIKNHWHSTLKKNYLTLLGKYLAVGGQQLQSGVQHEEDSGLSGDCFSNDQDSFGPFQSLALKQVPCLSNQEDDVGNASCQSLDFIFPPIVPLNRTSSDMTTVTGSQLSSSSNSACAISHVLQASSMPLMACVSSASDVISHADTVLSHDWRTSLHLQMQGSDNVFVKAQGISHGNQAAPNEGHAQDIFEELLYSLDDELMPPDYGVGSMVETTPQDDVMDDILWADLPPLDNSLLQLLDVEVVDKVNSFPFLNSSGGLLEDIVSAACAQRRPASASLQVTCDPANSFDQSLPGLQDSHFFSQSAQSQTLTKFPGSHPPHQNVENFSAMLPSDSWPMDSFSTGQLELVPQLSGHAVCNSQRPTVSCSAGRDNGVQEQTGFDASISGIRRSWNGFHFASQASNKRGRFTF